MTWRHDPAGLDKALTKEDLAKRRRALAMLSEHSDAYRQAWEGCKMQGDGLPRAATIQELVTVEAVVGVEKTARPVIASCITRRRRRSGRRAPYASWNSQGVHRLP